MVRKVSLLSLIGVFFLSLSIGCASQSASKASSASASSADPLSRFEGDVLVLLLGIEWCGNTKIDTQFLAEYSRTVPEGVSIARYDVPLPGQTTVETLDWKHGFHYGVDKYRKIAKPLSFFYYPTLYIFDRDGEVRYCGTCDENRVPDVVTALATEEPGAEKKLFSPVMLGAGEAAPDFSATSVDGKTVQLSKHLGKNATLLFFGAVTCPFAKRAVAQLPGFQSEFASKGLSIVIVNSGPNVKSAKPFYDETAPGIPVLRDDDASIGKKYGLVGVPFFYLLDGKGRVKEGLPFTIDAAKESVAAFLEGRESMAFKKAAEGLG